MKEPSKAATTAAEALLKNFRVELPALAQLMSHKKITPDVNEIAVIIENAWAEKGIKEIKD